MTFPTLRRSVLIAVLLVLSAGSACPVQAQDENVVDEIVAVVEDRIILRSEVEGFVAGISEQQGMEPTDDLWVQALNELVNQEVLAVHARRDTMLQVSDDQVEQALDERIQQLSSRLGSQSRIEELYGKSLIQIKADLREDFRDQMLAQQFQSRKVNTINITPTEVRRWFERIPQDSLPTLPETVRLAHIVRYPKVPASAEREALEIVSAIRDSIVHGGASLEDMARRFSEDTGSASRGGQYTNYEIQDLVPEFGAMAARVPIGELSEPFRTEFGYHILRVDNRRGDVVDFHHVLIRIDQSKADPTEAKQFLSQLRDSLFTHNVPFEYLARQHSEEQSSAEIGGRVLDPQTGERDLVLEALGPSWRRTLDTMDVGDVSKPADVELLNGDRAVHIVKLQRRMPEHRVSLATDYERIKQLALQDKQTRLIQEWIARLRDDVYIEYRGKAERLATSPSNTDTGLSDRLY